MNPLRICGIFCWHSLEASAKIEGFVLDNHTLPDRQEVPGMPTYSYFCSKCEKTFDAFHSMMSNEPQLCPNCGTAGKKLLSAGSVIFKGSGFYSTDYRDSGYLEAKNRDSGNPSRKSPDSSGSSSDKSSSAKTPAESPTKESAPPKCSSTNSKEAAQAA